MKKLFIICGLLLTISFFTRCEKETITLPENSNINNETITIDKIEFLKNLKENNVASKISGSLSAQVTINYTEVCGASTLGTFYSEGTVSYADLWDFYFFYGNEDDIITITVLSGDDSAISLYFGTTSNTNNVYPMSGGENMTFLMNGDDEIPNGCGDLVFGDPEIVNYVLPYTGLYTLTVFNWTLCGDEPHTYEIQTTGISCDSDNDADNDGILNNLDNCPFTANTNQYDYDGDGIGDVCDDDIDGDGILNNEDNCLLAENPNQEDTDADGIGDVCDDDADGDGILNNEDNCPLIANADQLDTDLDGIGDVCDDDIDGDGILNNEDNCPLADNPNQEDTDGDGIGDVCDVSGDSDGDGCIDDDDGVINSNMEATVDIAGCNTGVENRMTNTCGIMMSDMIDDLEGGAYTKKASFAKAVSILTSVWLGEGLINRAEYNLIMKCARKASY